MTEQRKSASAADVPVLLERLNDEDPLTREGARIDLVHVGTPAVPQLLELLARGEPHSRWEAAKALAEIAEPNTASALAEAMDDDDHDVRWVAAEGAAAMGRAGLRAVLTRLITHSDSFAYCESSHHAIKRLSAGHKEPILERVLEALRSEQRALATPSVAEKALEELQLL